MTVWNWERDGAPNALRRVITVPYATRNDDGTVTCPRCSKAIPLRERKDFESYTGAEYVKHYTAAHAIEDGHVLVNGFWFEPV